MKPRSLVLGGAGFIGSHLVEALVSEGHEVTVFDKIGIDTSNLKKILGRIKLIEGDFLDEWFLSSLPQNIDYIFHLISTTLPATSNLNPVYDIKSNLAPSALLIDQAFKHKVKKFIFISSGGTIYGDPEESPITEDHPNNPITSYAITKLAIEKYLFMYHKLYGMDYAVLRVSNPFGPRQPYDKKHGVIAVFINHVLAGEPLEIWGDGTIERDYLYIDDVIRAFITAYKKDTPSRIYNIGRGKSASLNEIVDIIRSLNKKEITVNYKPARSTDLKANVLDISRAESELGWKPEIDLVEGIRLTWEWHRKARLHD